MDGMRGVAEPAGEVHPDGSPAERVGNGAVTGTPRRAAWFRLRTALSRSERPARQVTIQKRIVLAIVVVAAAVRVPGILWGLPDELHPDEGVVVKGALGLIARHSFEPTVFYRPDHLEIKLDSIVFRIYAWFAGGQADVMAEQNLSVFIALARTVTVLWGLGAVVLAYLIGRQFGRWAGPVAAFLFAFFPPFVANSSLATPDVPLMVLLTAVVWSCLRYLDRPNWRVLVGACALTALAVAVKYPGALGAVAIIAVIIVVARRSGDRRRAIRHLALSPVAFLVALFVISPTLLTNFAAVRDQLVGQSGSLHLGAGTLGYGGRVLFYVGYVGGWVGPLLVVAAIIGLYHCLRTRGAASVPLFLGIAYWIAISLPGLHWSRWSLPIAISPLLLAAVGVSVAIERTVALRASGRAHSRPATTGIAILLVLTGIGQLLGAAVTSASFAAADTRQIARPWFAANAITKQNTVSDGYSPLAPGGPTLFTRQLILQDGAVRARNSRMKYVVISSYTYDRVAGDPNYAWLAEYIRAIEKLPPVAEWTPTGSSGVSGFPALAPWTSIDLLLEYSSGAWNGPTIKLYRLPAAVQPVG